MIYNGSADKTAHTSINSISNITVNPTTTIGKFLDTTGITIGDTISGTGTVTHSKNLTLTPSLTNNSHSLFTTTYTITKNGTVTTGKTATDVTNELNNNLYDPANNQ